MEYVRELNNLIQTSGLRNFSLLEGMAKTIALDFGAGLVLVGNSGRLLLSCGICGAAGLFDDIETKMKQELINKKTAAEIKLIPNGMENITVGELADRYAPGIKALGWDENGKCVVFPVNCRGKREATLVLHRPGAFSDAELFITITFAAAASLIMTGMKNSGRSTGQKDRKAARAIIKSLSYTEMESAALIFGCIANGAKNSAKYPEGVLVISKIADGAGITRSLVVTALRKLESAGALETRSLGAKGTYIKVKNITLMNEIVKMFP